MKKIAAAVLLTVLVAEPAVAAGVRNSIGVNYGVGLNGVWSLQGEFNLSSLFNKEPVALQVFWKSYSQLYYVPGTGPYKYNYTGIGAAAIYDLSSVIRLNNKIKPYAGLGLIILGAGLTGPTTTFPVPADSGGLYITGGVRYALTKVLSADLNYNNFGGLTMGAILNFD